VVSRARARKNSLGLASWFWPPSAAMQIAPRSGHPPCLTSRTVPDFGRDLFRGDISAGSRGRDQPPNGNYACMRAPLIGKKDPAKEEVKGGNDDAADEPSRFRTTTVNDPGPGLDYRRLGREGSALILNQGTCFWASAEAQWRRGGWIMMRVGP